MMNTQIFKRVFLPVVTVHGVETPLWERTWVGDASAGAYIGWRRLCGRKVHGVKTPLRERTVIHR